MEQSSSQIDRAINNPDKTFVSVFFRGGIEKIIPKLITEISSQISHNSLIKYKLFNSFDD